MDYSKANRRNFIKSASLISGGLMLPSALKGHSSESMNEKPLVNLVSDGLMMSPKIYSEKLLELENNSGIGRDAYHNGGITTELEEKFAKLTGKEKAVFLPTGTMANQLALKLLSEEKTKVFVPENSHIFRDEADAAQSVHQKRLIPVGKDVPFFTKSDLQKTIAYHKAGEVFKSGMGAMAVEHPIRRADGAAVPFEVLKELSTYAKSEGIKLHLDGARIPIANAYYNSDIQAISALFDTVYISLYKCYNATHGAILCGDESLISKIPHLIKIYGGTTYQSWGATAIASHYFDSMETDWKQTKSISEEFMKKLNEKGHSFESPEFATNIHFLKLKGNIDVRKLLTNLRNDHQVITRPPLDDGKWPLHFNPSILQMTVPELVHAFDQSLSKAKG